MFRDKPEKEKLDLKSSILEEEKEEEKEEIEEEFASFSHFAKFSDSRHKTSQPRPTVTHISELSGGASKVSIAFPRHSTF